ncbi:response regulator transcription factor [Amycolatopsis sp. Hca4]|uniref:response regulator n=1 Tax=Amycolatopsis sp. Hca4 TaxID=2742131 RepID=UPI0020CB2C72|nr:response regulator transcription factor [Amycolatopsis sp. Hca4]
MIAIKRIDCDQQPPTVRLPCRIGKAYARFHWEEPIVCGSAAVHFGGTMSHATGFGYTTRLWPVEQLDPAPLTVLLADTQPSVRHGVRAALEQAGGVFVVGEAATANGVIAETARHRPDVLVVDPQLGGAGPADVIGRVALVSPETKVLVLSAADDDTAVRSAIHAGARGYLVKGADAEQIVRGVRVVAAGEAIVGRAIAARFSALVRTSAPEPYPFPQLTTRERQVLDRIAAGRSNAVIARDLGLASKTISNRVSAVFAKLGVADRAQAIVLARDAGLGRGEFTGDREQFPYRGETGRT